MTSSTISVIVPAYNGARWIAATLQSIVDQTSPPGEIIVVDDGSNDSTVDIAAGFGNLVRVLRRQRGGPAAARNTGIVEARGAFLALLDQDDLWVPDKLALQLAAFQDDPSLDVCVGHIQSFRDEPPPDAGMRNVGEPVAGYITTTMLARRTAFDRVGLLDPVLEHGDSADWFLRADELGVSVRLLTDVLILHRLHDANHSLTHGDASRREFLRLAKARVDRLRGRATSGQDL